MAGRYLAEAGADVAFYLYKPRDVEQDANYARVLQMGLFVVEAGLDQRYRVLRTRLQNTDIIVDALLGTGVTRAIGGNLAGVFKQVKSFLATQDMVPEREEPLTRIASVEKENGAG